VRSPNTIRVTAALAAATLILAARPAQAQEGSDWARVGGGALGLYSGAVLGTVGSLIPCSQTYAGARCVRGVGILGGLTGLTAGFYLGDLDEDAVVDAYRGAGYGLLIGSAAGLVLTQVVERYNWADVAATGLVGAAVGSSAKGAAIGLAAGSIVGLGLYWAIPSFDMPNAVGVAVMGMALGGISSWVVRSVEADQADSSAQPVVVSYRIVL